MKRGMTYPTVIVLDLLLAGTAILGGVFVLPTLPREWLAGTPFSSYLFPAMALTLIGLVGLIGAIELSFERPFGILASFAGGLAITAFEIVQIAVLTPRRLAATVRHWRWTPDSRQRRWSSSCDVPGAAVHSPRTRDSEPELRTLPPGVG